MEKILTDYTEKPREDIEVDLVWNVTEMGIEQSHNETKISTPYDVILLAECSEKEFYDACPLFDTCKQNLSELYDKYMIALRQIEIFKENHRNGLITMCYVGLFFGGLIGASTMFLICCLKDRKVSHMLEKTNEKQKLRKAIKERSQLARKDLVYVFILI